LERIITKVCQSGNSQAVRIPQEFQIPDKEVEILKRGDELVIRPIRKQSAVIIFDVLAGFEGEGDIEREEFKFQERN
jgi:antitoxin VapB